MSKTGRIYGKLFAAIRGLAERQKPFKVTEFLPDYSRRQASNCCSYLKRVGELELLNAGTVGRNAKPAVYRLKAVSPTARALAGQPLRWRTRRAKRQPQ